ncbi:hypothetical protein CEXT_161351 [Caerostris extrusa]|uniref:SWIM-type domain-containing protein n=1 Tax=Caerostris extrusa TaxID=172846 RepID=A0AAV4NZL8_CAEEX|nr:hypothetical protein CEXT_161351 [Caerostris extrusa]
MQVESFRTWKLNAQRQLAGTRHSLRLTSLPGLFYLSFAITRKRIFLPHPGHSDRKKEKVVTFWKYDSIECRCDFPKWEFVHRMICAQVIPRIKVNPVILVREKSIHFS